MPHPTEPPVTLSAPPSAYRLPKDYNLGGAYGSVEADNVAAVIVLYSQARNRQEPDREGWEPAVRAVSPLAIAALAGLMGGAGAKILAHLDGPWDPLGTVNQMVEDGYLSHSTGTVDGDTVTTIVPTEKFLVPLAPFRA